MSVGTAAELSEFELNVGRLFEGKSGTSDEISPTLEEKVADDVIVALDDRSEAVDEVGAGVLSPLLEVQD